MILKNKKRRGSILVFSLFLMMITLIIGIGLISTSVSGRKSSISTAKSVNSFQVADSCLEHAFRGIREYEDKYSMGATQVNLRTLDNVVDYFVGTFGVCDPVTNAVEISNISGGNCEMYFYNNSNNLLDCDATTDTDSEIRDIYKIKTVGTYNNITRSVEASGLNLTDPTI